jgi:DnaJ-class molecular chaperone
MKVFAQFFGGEDPFATFFTSSGGGSGHQMQGGGIPGGTFMSFGPGGMHNMNGKYFGNFNFVHSPRPGMHGGGMGRHANGSAPTKRQDPSVTHDLLVSLEDIFKGATKKMKITRKVLNPDGQTTSVEDKVLTIQVG